MAGVGGCSANSRPTWFAEVGPLRERTRKGRGPPRQRLGSRQPVVGGRVRRRPGPFRALTAVGPGRSTRCCSVPAWPSSPGLLLSLAFEPVAVRLPDPRRARRLRAEHPTACRLRRAWIPGLVFGVALLLRRTSTGCRDSIGTARLARAAHGSEALFYGAARGGRGALRPAAVLAGLARRRLGDDRALAQRVAVQRDAVGTARLRRRRHPGGRTALPYVGMSGLSPSCSR